MSETTSIGMKNRDHIPKEWSHPAMTLSYFKMRLKAIQKQRGPLVQTKRHFDRD